MRIPLQSRHSQPPLFPLEELGHLANLQARDLCGAVLKDGSDKQPL